MAFRQRLCIGRGRWILGVVFLARQVDFFVRKDMSDMCCKSRNVLDCCCWCFFIIIMILLRSICWLHLNMFSCIHCAVTVLVMDTSKGDLRPKVDLEAGGWPHPIAVGCHRPFRTKCHVTTWQSLTVPKKSTARFGCLWRGKRTICLLRSRAGTFFFLDSELPHSLELMSQLCLWSLQVAIMLLYIGDHVASRCFYHCSDYGHLRSIVARQDRGYFRKYYGDKDIYDIESWPGFEKL